MWADMQFDLILFRLFVHAIMIYSALKISGGFINVISNRAYLKEKQTRADPHERSEQKKKGKRMR
jgi:hypothetical protein